MLEGITLLYRSSDLKVNFPFCRGDFVTLSENTTYNNIKHEAFDTDFNLITQLTMIVNTKLSVWSFFHLILPRLRIMYLHNHWFRYLFSPPCRASHNLGTFRSHNQFKCTEWTRTRELNHIDHGLEVSFPVPILMLSLNALIGNIN